MALMLAQVFVHSCMAGLRIALPLEALEQGQSVWAAGFLVALFAGGPVLLAMAAGRMAERRGYHPSFRVAVILCLLGAAMAWWGQGWLSWAGAALCSGTGANFGVIAMQRTAGRWGRDDIERVKLFSWLGLAPAAANVVGPLMAGVLVDVASYRWAYAAMAVLPLCAWALSLRVPADAPVPAGAGADASGRVPTGWGLLRDRPFRWLLGVNWLHSAAWDVHSFLLPVLGHERGLSASAIGSIAAAFALAVSAVRLLIPLVAHRVSERQVLQWAMVWTAAVLTAYIATRGAWGMGICAVLLGLSLGSVQPMILSALHRIAPEGQQGQAIALRSVAINTSSTLMPLAFGALGTAVGSVWLLGGMAVVMLLGSRAVKNIPAPEETPAKTA